MGQVLDLSVRDHVATVTLSRPNKGNAINTEMFAALSGAGRQIAQTEGVRAVVLCGEGEHFCTGIDISSFSASEDLGNKLQPLPDSAANLFQDVAFVWRELDVPVIAALHGAVFGGGLQIAMGADVRIAHPDTRCSVMEIRWGIIPDMALTATMRDVVRLDQLRELVYTGRVVAAEEARSIGLLTSLDENPLNRAAQLAAEIAGRSPDAVQAAKALLRDGFDLPVEKSLRREAELQGPLLGGANQREAVISNMEKREPRFCDIVKTG